MDQDWFWVSRNTKVNMKYYSESEHQAKFSSPDSALALLASSISWHTVQRSQVFKFTEGQDLLA